MCRRVLNPQDVGFEERGSAAIPKRVVQCEEVMKRREYEIEFRRGDSLAFEGGG